MNNGELIKLLQALPLDAPVYFRNCVNPCGNMNEVYGAKADTYGFFGESLPCVILEDWRDENAKEASDE